MDLDLAAGTLVAERYRIEGPLGEGGMGVVFRARHELMDKPVALKLLHPSLADSAEAKARFIREARAAARIRHPNVVDVYDVGLHAGSPFLVMELLEGESLAVVMQRGGLPIASVLRLLIGSMQGVAAAHRHHIIHRDIKPENIFVVSDDRYPEGFAKVLDFGISKLTDLSSRTESSLARGTARFDARASSEGLRVSMTRTGATMGTPCYMSFEQMRGTRDIDRRTDIYSFGVLLYRMLTGTFPFGGDTIADIAVQMATYQPPSPSQFRPELPASLDAIVMKAAAVDRDQRYASLDALIDALTRLGASDTEWGQLSAKIALSPLVTPSTPALVRGLSSTSYQQKQPAQAAASAERAPLFSAGAPGPKTPADLHPLEPPLPRALRDNGRTPAGASQALASDIPGAKHEPKLKLRSFGLASVLAAACLIASLVAWRRVKEPVVVPGQSPAAQGEAQPLRDASLERGTTRFDPSAAPLALPPGVGTAAGSGTRIEAADASTRPVTKLESARSALPAPKPEQPSLARGSARFDRASRVREAPDSGLKGAPAPGGATARDEADRSLLRPAALPVRGASRLNIDRDDPYR